MTRYIVFEPPAPDDLGDVSGDGPTDRAVFVRDAFAKWALFFPFLWLFRHRLILPGLLVLGLSVAIALLAEQAGLGLAASVLPILLGALVALEGPSLRAARYLAKGFREAAVIDALDAEEAEILYYAGRDGDATEAPPASPFAPASVARAPRQRPFSLLDPAGRR